MVLYSAAQWHAEAHLALRSVDLTSLLSLHHVCGELGDLGYSSRHGHLLHAYGSHLANPCPNLLRRARQGGLLDHPLGYQWSMLRLKLGTIPSVEVQMAGLERGIGGAVSSLKGHEVIADVSWQLVGV